MNIFRKLQALLRYCQAVRLADKAYASTGERHYVMPVSGSKCKLIVMDRRNFRILKRKHYASAEARIADLERECFYCTPYRNGTGALSEDARLRKKNSYFAWSQFCNSRRARSV